MADSKETKSGICSPANYNGKAPASIAAPVKIYPGSNSLGKGASKTGGMIEGPASGGGNKAGA